MWILLLILWSLCGMEIFFLPWTLWNISTPGCAPAWGFLNPYYLKKYTPVNWFGAIFVALICNLICPIASIGYWIFVLCTIGGK